MDSRIVFFEDIKPENTDVTFRLVRERAGVLGIKKLVLASATGVTARKAMDFFKDKGVKLIVVPHQLDFQKKAELFPLELVKTLRESGHDVLFGSAFLSTDKLSGSDIPGIMANLLSRFCQGVKVCFEIVFMVTDAGLVAGGEKVIAIAGSGQGLDTALVMQAGSPQRIGQLRVNDIICQPLSPLSLGVLKDKLAQEMV